MKKIYILLLLIALTATTKVKAQALTALQYSIGFTTGDFKDFIGATSWRGFTFDYRKKLNDNVGVGLEFGWNIYDERMDWATYKSGTEAITGVQYRYCSALPVLVSGDYYFKPGEMLNPFVGLGVGTMYTRNDVDMGVYTIYDDIWHFAVKPELGVIIKPGSDVGFIITGKYYSGFKAEDVSRSYIAANVGLVWEY